MSIARAAKKGGRASKKKRSYASDVRIRGKEETREALIASALALFSERGLDEPSIDDICAHAGYSRGAFYAHFGDRDALMVAAMRSRRKGTFDGLIASIGGELRVRALLELLASLVASGAFPPKGGVRTAEFLQACRRSRDLRKAHHDLLDATARRLAEAVARDQAAGALRADVDPTALAALFVVLEAGVEVMADLGWPYDVTGVAKAASHLIAKPRSR